MSGEIRSSQVESVFTWVKLATIKNTIILFLCPSKILHKHCFYFLLGLIMVPRETENNAYAKTKSMVFLIVANR